MTGAEAIRCLIGSLRGKHVLRELKVFLPLMHEMTHDQVAAVLELVRRTANGHHKSTLEHVREALEPQ
jgi:hypothetical protein